MKLPDHHKHLDTLHVGTLPPRAYFIPYANALQADCGDRKASPYYTDLCGTWKFRFFDSFEDIEEEFYSDAFDISELPCVPVPGCMQLYDCCPDKPLYSNLKYPFPTDPPYVPDRNPCAAHIREFNVTEEMLRRGNIITFEGVSSCFYLWVNSAFVGYSQVSHCTSEFDVSAYLHAGANRLCVLVVKWCDGSYLEDQDYFRFSGIFREVYMLSRCREHIEDFEIKQSFAEDLSSASVSLNIKSSGGEVSYKLISPAGKCVAKGITASSSAVIHIPGDDLVLWNDEQPERYRLYLVCGDETVLSHIALREVKIRGKALLLNGRPIRLRGINRHDSTENGYVVTESDMLRDLTLLKQANVNTIRTSHYPNDPRFVELCEEMGFYLVDEADIETHGMGFNTDADWDWMRWSLLSTIPEWRGAYVDRAARLYERDKNRGCVIMWSLGNESGCGVNHRAMREYIKNRDPNALVHYENAHLEFKAVPEGEDFSDISDVESRMYAGVDYIEKYLNDPKHEKPFFMCEYVDSMSTGDVYDYWKFADEYDQFSGGCIWEFTDHAVCIPDTKGKKRYYYGGDFDDFPNDGICCIDGLVFPDRTPRPGYYDMKKVYEPFRGRFENGVLYLKNLRSFASLDDQYLDWRVTAGGKTIDAGSIDPVGCLPGKEIGAYLFDPAKYQDEPDCFLTVSVRSKNASGRAEEGFETGFLQFELGVRETAAEPSGAAVELDEGNRFVSIKAGENEYTFDKSYGRICSIRRCGKELLTQPTRFTIWRAPCYNRGSVDAWIANHFDHVAQKTYSVEVSADGSSVTIRCRVSLGAPANPPLVRMELTFSFFGDGSFSVKADGSVRDNLPVLPRLGMELSLIKELDTIRYFGLGETETYPDRYRSARYGEYELSVDENFVHYIRPQENGAHYKTRRAELGAKGGAGLFVTGDGIDDFSFNASRYSSEQLARTTHDFELVDEDRIVFNIDWRQNAISENGLLDNDENNRLLDDKTFSFGFRIMPIDFD